MRAALLVALGACSSPVTVVEMTAHGIYAVEVDESCAAPTQSWTLAIGECYSFSDTGDRCSDDVRELSGRVERDGVEIAAVGDLRGATYIVEGQRIELPAVLPVDTTPDSVLTGPVRAFAGTVCRRPADPMARPTLVDNKYVNTEIETVRRDDLVVRAISTATDGEP